MDAPWRTAHSARVAGQCEMPGGTSASDRSLRQAFAGKVCLVCSVACLACHLGQANLSWLTFISRTHLKAGIGASMHDCASHIGRYVFARRNFVCRRHRSNACPRRIDLYGMMRTDLTHHGLQLFPDQTGRNFHDVPWTRLGLSKAFT